MTLKFHPRLRLFVLSALYFTQGIPTGFVTITLAAFWAGQGYSAAAVAALLVVSYLPWALKLLYGPLVDQYAESPMGRRRPWILGAQAGMAVSLAAMLLVPGVAHRPVVLAALLFVHNAFGSLQDVATDALAVDLLSPEERGRANGVMWGGKVLGIALGGAGLSTLMEQTSFKVVLIVQVVILGAVMLLPLLVRERSGEPRLAAPGAIWTAWQEAAAEQPGWRHVVDELIEAFRPTRARTVGGLALVAGLPTRMLVAIGPVFAVQAAGWTDLGYSQFAGGPALLMGAVGAVSGGWVADRLGRRRTLLAAEGVLLALLTAFAFAQPWWNTTGVVAAFVGGGVLLDMTLKATLAALFMDVTREHVAATQFTAYMTLGNLCNVLGSGLIIPLDAIMGFRGLFLSAAACSVGILAFLLWTPLRRTLQTASG
jgi:PAT family beta-lactamase induction signal transducer AmpG